MCPPYHVMAKSKNHKFDLRLHLVRDAIQNGIRATMRAYECSRNTVRMWLRRFQQEGIRGLEERSRAAKSCPHKTSAEDEREVLKQRARTPGFGAERLKREFELKASVGAIKRILKQAGLTKRRKKKHRTKRDLREVKARYAPLTHLQMDVKYLDDIPHYWPYIQMGFPKFQYTIRDVKTGGVFLAYGKEVSVLYAELTIRRLLNHLAKHAVPVEEIVVSTDRGGEFDGSAVHKDDRGFTYAIEQESKAYHHLNRPHTPNDNADVETFHSHEEPEFFDIEHFRNTGDFWRKITTYQNYWNYARPNSYKWNKTPLDILTESASTIRTSVFLLPPVDLDTLAPLSFQLGHHVPVVTVHTDYSCQVG